jgi:hypothetical protein
MTHHLLSLTSSTHVEEIEVIQSLWSGYGKISRYRLEGAKWETVVVKCISLQEAAAHPRGWNTNRSHERKMRSYEVETHWYQHYHQQCTEACRIPQFIGSFTDGKNQWIVMEDLDQYFPLRKEHLSFSEVKICLKWLANFHATFLGKAPHRLWETGTYWYLATRPDEFEKINHTELKSKAKKIDQLLNQCEFKTIVHGDAKVANFCFSTNRKTVAAVDFQYVGGGCGMKDVAYFLGSCLSSEECALYESEVLDCYFSELKMALEHHDLNINPNALEKEWRSLYPIAIADFTRFLLGWMPTHHKVNDYHMNTLNQVLKEI